METASSTTTTTVIPPKSKKTLIIALVIGAVSLALCICAVVFFLIRGSQTNTPNAIKCTYNGANYTEGSSFKSTDGCNTCSCGSDGIVACTDMACNVGENPEPTPTPAPDPIETEETLIGKLLVTDSDYFYGTTRYPEAVMGLKAADLLSITCYENHYYNGSAWISDTTIMTDVKVTTFLNSMPSKPLNASYCLTAEGKYIVQYSDCSGQCGGGTDTIAYFGILENNILTKVTEIPNQLGAYYACTKVLALTKNYEFYITCGAGDGGGSAGAIYKVFLNQGNYTEIAKESNNQ